MSDFVVPDKVSPEIGWRVWLVVAHEAELLLHSAVQAKVEWPVRQALRAECRRVPVLEIVGEPRLGAGHEAPEETCGTGGGHGCGIYAAKTASACADFLKGSYSPSQVRGAGVVHRVIGKVALWGKVIEGELGWRAEYAYPAEIWIPREFHVTSGIDIGAVRPPGLPLEEVAYGLAAYGVPVSLTSVEPDTLAA